MCDDRQFCGKVEPIHQEGDQTVIFGNVLIQLMHHLQKHLRAEAGTDILGSQHQLDLISTDNDLLLN